MTTFLRLATISIVLSGCSEQQSEKSPALPSSRPIETPGDFTGNKSTSAVIATTDTLEYFADSTSFGRRGRMKIELRTVRHDDSLAVNVKLYKGKAHKWRLLNEQNVANHALTGLNAIVCDYNDDGYKDIVFTSAEAARGGNNVQTLLLFQPATNTLLAVKNSEWYPNLTFNRELNCVTSVILTGSVTTAFLHLQQDSLVEFARAELESNGTTVVSLIDRLGREKRLTDTSDSRFQHFARHMTVF